MHNLYQQFRALLPQAPLQVGTVAAAASGVVTVQLPAADGSTHVARPMSARTSSCAMA